MCLLRVWCSGLCTSLHTTTTVSTASEHITQELVSDDFEATGSDLNIMLLCILLSAKCISILWMRQQCYYYTGPSELSNTDSTHVDFKIIETRVFYFYNRQYNLHSGVITTLPMVKIDKTCSIYITYLSRIRYTVLSRWQIIFKPMKTNIFCIHGRPKGQTEATLDLLLTIQNQLKLI